MPKGAESAEKSAHLGIRLAQAIQIKAQAEGREIKQVEVARRFKVAQSTVSHDWLEKGRIAKKHYAGLVGYFGLPYEWWFGEAGADKKITEVLSAMLRMSEKGKEEAVRAVRSIVRRRSVQVRHEEATSA